VVGPQDERPPFQDSRKPGGATSLTKRHLEHLLQEHAQLPRAATPPCAGAASPPQVGAASPRRPWVVAPPRAGAGAAAPPRALRTGAATPSLARRAGGGGTSSLPCFLDGQLHAMCLLEEEALGFTSW
jgi:hypothetical protein